jgi:hypothetical protein
LEAIPLAPDLYREGDHFIGWMDESEFRSFMRVFPPFNELQAKRYPKS